MDITIKYLVPLLVVFNNKNYFCMIDYATSNLYFIDEPEDLEIKKILEKEILKKVDDVAVDDFQGNAVLNKDISSIIKDIENNKFINQYKFELDLNKEKEKEDE